MAIWRGRAAALLATACLVALTTITVPALPASACSCVGFSPREAMAAADVVFEGRVVSVDAQRSHGMRYFEVRFDVARVYQGTAYQEQVLTTADSSASCGLSLVEGQSWLIYARYGSVDTPPDVPGAELSTLITGLCSGSTPSDGVTPEQTESLASPVPPVAGASDTVQKAQTIDTAVDRTIMAVGIGVVAVIALAALGLFLLWRPRSSE